MRESNGKRAGTHLQQWVDALCGRVYQQSRTTRVSDARPGPRSGHGRTLCGGDVQRFGGRLRNRCSHCDTERGGGDQPTIGVAWRCVTPGPGSRNSARFCTDGVLRDAGKASAVKANSKTDHTRSQDAQVARESRFVHAITPQGTRAHESGAMATFDSHRVSPLPGWRTRWQPRRKMPREGIALSARD